MSTKPIEKCARADCQPEPVKRGGCCGGEFAINCHCGKTLDHKSPDLDYTIEAWNYEMKEAQK